MDWNLLAVVPPIFMGVMLLVLLWGARQMWKVNNKFIAFVFLVMAVAIGIAFYALYGKKFFG